LSFALNEPQFRPYAEQNVWSDQAMQHAFAVQTLGALHVVLVAVPQFTCRVRPQLSAALMVPQFALWAAQNVVSDSGMQQTLFVQTSGVPHAVFVAMPQSTVRVTPHLSAAVRLPQFLPSRPQNALSLS
jgi:hypothetical protein